jgi:hypothetical protein
MKYLVFLLIFFTTFVFASEPQSPASTDAQKRLDYVANIQRFQGMYESVAIFCGTYVPAHILDRSKSEWLGKNQSFLDLRDKELSKVIAVATANGATPEELSKIRAWVADQYESRLHHDRLYKDLIGVTDLTVPCSKRLGEMVSDSMSLKTLSPESIEYFNTVAGEP